MNKIYKKYLARNIGVKKPINKIIKEYLKANGVIATPHLIEKGSLAGCIRITQKNNDPIRKLQCCGYASWGEEWAIKMTSLGFLGNDCKPLDKFSGNGGLFHIFARMSKELKKDLGLFNNNFYGDNENEYTRKLWIYKSHI